jgi:hypothetical protein
LSASVPLFLTLPVSRLSALDAAALLISQLTTLSVVAAETSIASNHLTHNERSLLTCPGVSLSGAFRAVNNLKLISPNKPNQVAENYSNGERTTIVSNGLYDTFSPGDDEFVFVRFS